MRGRRKASRKVGFGIQPGWREKWGRFQYQVNYKPFKRNKFIHVKEEEKRK